MKNLIFALLATSCVIIPRAYGASASLGWWFSPDYIEDLPIELEEDDNGYWTEMWVRPGVDSSVEPHQVMEQAVGARWLGLDPDKEGLPTHVVLVFAGEKVVEFKGPELHFGTLDNEKVTWSDKTTSTLVAYRRRRHKRHASTRVNFGKVSLPPTSARSQVLSDWGAERLPALLKTLSTGGPITLRDLSVPAQIYDSNGSFLNFRFADNCSTEARTKIEDVLAQEVEPRLTCWMEQNPEGAAKLLSALLLRPTLDCKTKAPIPTDACGSASVPYLNSFFLSEPSIHVSLDRCKGELHQTLLHETLHLAGIKDAEMDPALTAAESCRTTPAEVSYENKNEGFFNDFEVQTRIFLFHKVRDDAVDKWHWSEGERDFLLGTICTKMGDKYCSRNYFQKAVEAKLNGTVTLPEGDDVSWSALSQFSFYDSVTEDVQRMHELAKYLKRDPNGALLRRMENGGHRLHEFFVAREALEAVKNNKGVCNGQTDDHIFCEDLSEVVKSAWFKHP